MNKLIPSSRVLKHQARALSYGRNLFSTKILVESKQALHQLLCFELSPPSGGTLGLQLSGM